MKNVFSALHIDPITKAVAEALSLITKQQAEGAETVIQARNASEYETAVFLAARYADKHSASVTTNIETRTIIIAGTPVKNEPAYDDKELQDKMRMLLLGLSKDDMRAAVKTLEVDYKFTSKSTPQAVADAIVDQIDASEIERWAVHFGHMPSKSDMPEWRMPALWAYVTGRKLPKGDIEEALEKFVESDKNKVTADDIEVANEYLEQVTEWALDNVDAMRIAANRSELGTKPKATAKQILDTAIEDPAALVALFDYLMVFYSDANKGEAEVEPYTADLLGKDTWMAWPLAVMMDPDNDFEDDAVEVLDALNNPEAVEVALTEMRDLWKWATTELNIEDLREIASQIDPDTDFTKAKGPGIVKALDEDGHIKLVGLLTAAHERLEGGKEEEEGGKLFQLYQALIGQKAVRGEANNRKELIANLAEVDWDNVKLINVTNLSALANITAVDDATVELVQEMLDSGDWADEKIVARFHSRFADWAEEEEAE